MPRSTLTLLRRRSVEAHLLRKAIKLTLLDPGRTSKTMRGARRRSVIVSVLESLRQHLLTFTLSNVINEVRRWCETSVSCFAKLLRNLKLTRPSNASRSWTSFFLHRVDSLLHSAVTPVSVRALKEVQHSRVTSGKLPEVDLTILREALKARHARHSHLYTSSPEHIHVRSDRSHLRLDWRMDGCQNSYH